MTLPNAWEVEGFDGPRDRLSFQEFVGAVADLESLGPPNIGRDLSGSVRQLYERRLLTRAMPGALDRRFISYDPEVSEVFSAAGEAAGKVLEEGLSEVEET